MLPLLPGLPQQQNGKGKNDEKKETLGVHGRKSLRRGVSTGTARDRRDGVDSSRVPRMTPHQATGNKPQPPGRTMAGDRLAGVLRTAGIKTARLPQPGTQQALVEPEEEDEEADHRVSLSRSATNSARTAACAGREKLRCTRTTRSRLSAAVLERRKASRNTRRMRLRFTARGATRRATTMAARGRPSSLGLPKTTRCVPAARRRKAKTDEISSVLRRRSCLLKPLSTAIASAPPVF